MSAVAISPRPHPPVRTDRTGPARSPATLTLTVDLASGSLTPRLARLLDLIGELAESGEGRLRAGGAVPTPRTPEFVPAGPSAAVDPPAARPDEVRILAGSRVVRHGDRAVPLTRIEYDLLLFLAERPRRVFTRLQLLANVWGYEHAVARTVDVHVRRLRAKFGVDTPVVTTVYGVGYRLADDAPIAVDPTR
ncbi:winged helix-turn-helix domain-containing protein [Micromonospora krabiensis]|uniref:Transcriptional regulatory protein, C terminal n=1 Tax=Micromonospora krabiensis TaxID=307121 RepID=A0A1C3N0S9_9ACTN|nr:winged helix-turn-helix domain-containing protein [Micromonospora krabiensis]SBV26165.1 Transcriptional regulatory protein, C terminal [Micromonospora krabiensis]